MSRMSVRARVAPFTSQLGLLFDEWGYQPRGLKLGMADSRDGEVLSAEHLAMFHLTIALAGHHPLLTPCPFATPTNMDTTGWHPKRGSELALAVVRTLEYVCA